MESSLQQLALRFGAAFALGVALPAQAQSLATEAAAPPTAEAVSPTAAPSAEPPPTAVEAEAAPAGAAPPAADAAAAPGVPAAPEAAAGNDASSGGLEEVIVTARRTEERLQDVPISITVFNQEQLTDRNVMSGSDLATYTPSLSANGRYGSENTTFAIRGFSQESRTTASVGMFFADVVAPRGGASSTATGDGAGPGQFFDLANVQVLKGPQGTLFGRNTTGGAVLLVPKKPTPQFEGYAEGSVGDYGMSRMQAVVNLPINDRLRLRLGGDTMKRDGYLTNTTGIGAEDYNDVDYYALRASLVADLAANVENYTIASYSRSDNHGLAFTIAESANQRADCVGAGTPPVPSVFSQLACLQLQRQQELGDYDVQEFAPDSMAFLETWQVINTTTWNISDNLTLKNIASYSELLNKLRTDLFGSAWVVPENLYVNLPASAGGGVRTVPTGQYAGTRLGFNTFRFAPGTSNANQSNFTEELQLQGNSDDRRLVWQTGVYLEHSDPIDDNAVISVSRLACADYATLQCTDVLAEALGSSSALGSVTSQVYHSTYRNYGVYLQSTYQLTEQFNLTGGIRYTWDEVESYGQNVSYTFPDPNVARGTCANPLLRAPTDPITDPSQCDDNPTAKSDAPTWLLGLDYKPMEDVLLYAKYARGYRQGSANPLAAGGFTTFGPEQVDSYEIGSKLSWRGAVPGNFNFAVFYNDFQDQQLSLALSSSTNSAPPNQAIVNVGKSEIKGFEIEASLLPFRGMKLTGSYAYLDAKLKSATTPTFPEGSPYDGYTPLAVGRPLPYTPENKLSLNADYTFPLPTAVGDVSGGLTYSYTDEQIVSYGSHGSFPSYKRVDANLNWRSVAQSDFDLSFFVTNLTDEQYITNVSDFYDTASFGWQAVLYGDPRMYGARLRWNFGG